MSDLKTKLKIFGSALFVFLTIFVLDLVLFSATKNASHNYVLKNQEKILLAKQRSGLNELKKNYGESMVVENLVKTSFIDKTKVVDFIIFLEGLGAQAGGIIQIPFASEPKLEDKTQNSYLININFDGSYASLIKFISLLENSPYAVVVDFVEVSQEEDPVAKQNYLKAKINIRVLTI